MYKVTRKRFSWRATPDRSWRSTWTASRGFLLIATGVLLAIFQQWLAAALAVAVGVSALLYARRKYPEWRARQRW